MAKVLSESELKVAEVEIRSEPQAEGTPAGSPVRQTDRIFNENRLAKENMLSLLVGLGLSRADAANILKLASASDAGRKENDESREGT